MKSITYTLLAYAILILIGGIIGFVKAGSSTSLIMSASFSSLILLSTLLMRYQFKAGFYSAFSIALTLCAFFAYRFFLMQKFVPNGLMLLISLLTIAKLLFTKNESDLCKNLI